MSTLKHSEKLILEKFLKMGGGYVLDFIDRTFGAFITDSVGVDIWDEKFKRGSGSKANRMRGLWQIESDAVNAKVIVDLVEHWRTSCVLDSAKFAESDEALSVEVLKIAARLKANGSSTVALGSPAATDENFEVLSRAIKDSIEKREPGAALDRLHTYVVRYLRTVCSANGITVAKEKPLHSLIGEYIKALKQTGKIETEMTSRILKNSISLLEAFNDVRNNRSLAHDNSVLNHEESLLIFNSVASIVHFIDALEAKRKKASPPLELDEEVPF